MTRLKSDLLLLLAAFIWGTAFVAQKTGMDGLGPIGFVGLRFIVSFFCVLPLAIYEYKKTPFDFSKNSLLLLFIAVSLLFGMCLQQTGLITTSVTNAGFLTGLYVVVTPFVALIYLKMKIRKMVWFASCLAFTGIWLLSGASIEKLIIGDWYVIASAVAFAVYIVLLGQLMMRSPTPLTVTCLIYLFCACVATPYGAMYEGISFSAIEANIWPLLYVGALSGGFAFTIQAFAQQTTPPAVAAVIFSAESLFAALAGVILLGERMALIGVIGCVLIFVSMLIVECKPKKK